ncbi:MAG: ferredoxin--NADP reductase [Pseudomonadota bacterium]
MGVENLVLPKSVTLQHVESVHHWTEELFSLRVTRPSSFRFRSGEFVMLGLLVEGRPLLRAYSIASPSWDDSLEFFSIKVEDGPLTSRLRHVKPGDEVILGRKPTGTLVLDALLPGNRLFLLSTGTGIAPFASLLREPETYERFDEVVLTHTCRNVADLKYGAELVESLANDPLVGEVAPEKLIYYASVTREKFSHQGRITHLIENGQLFQDLGIAGIQNSEDRFMICGSMAMIADTRELLEVQGLKEGSNAAPGDFVVEKAFAE